MRIYITIALFTGVFFWLGYSVYILDQSDIYAENGVLENIQVFTLLAACITFFLPVIYQKREDKLILVFFALLCLAFILREVDVEKLDIPSILIFMGSGIGRNILLAFGFITIIIYAVLNNTYYQNLVKVFILSKEGILLIIAGLLLGIGDYFEHAKLLHHHVFIEEMFELSGYTVILLTALMFSKNKLSHL